MHILITTNSSWNVVNFRSALVRALLADGHKVTVLAPAEVDSRQIQSWGCGFVALDMDRTGLSPLRDCALLFRLLGHFLRSRPDVVLSYTIKNNLYGAIAARLLRIPFIPNVTGLGTAFLSSGLASGVAPTLYKIAFSGVPRVFFQNRDDLALFLKRRLVRVGRASIIPGSGIDLAHFAPATMPRKPEEVVFLLIARMLRDKGVVEYVEAAKIVRRRYPDARFQLLGQLDAENRTALTAKDVEAWVAEGTVEYLGKVDDVRPFIATSDCVVLPSYREGLPKTLLEAAAMERPLVATDVPGCREIVEHGVNGMLCEVRSAIDLAAKIIAMIEIGPVARSAMGRAGRRKVKAQFDQSLVIEAYREVINTVSE